ncbi:double-stranded RNA-binding protein Staufen homolog 2 isoform X2 [Venturia canescens]|uniref:double-stranded RNA-binding protein Staufen homolog 2 isoform X2 n=1 Tax=Venturia canescens TaxID=32260 RepID=UPI001C9CE5C7|nr:double-stranded RNA-binding protein Staufen homolog 2 isoform X2 [Venturia canescens]
MQNQLRENKFVSNMMMGGPVRPMQPSNMVPPHQAQHMHAAAHRTPQQMQHQQILSMHHMQHSIPPGSNPRQPVLMSVNAQNSNGKMVTIGLNRQMEPNAQMVAHPSQMLQQQRYQQQTPLQQPQQQKQQHQQLNTSQQTSTEQKKVSSNQEDNDGVDERDESPSSRPLNPNPANVTSAVLANMKEKTPMCLVNELARFNKLQHQYRLTNEQGPAHKKRFTVTLKLGEEEYVAEGQSIKKAQHSAATEALTTTWYRHPPPKPTRAMRVGHLGKGSSATGNLPPTVELNSLAMKRGELTVYTIRNAPPATPQPFFQPGFGIRPPRLFNPHFPQFAPGFTPKREKLYLVTLKVGDREFIGRGATGQAARHDAASRALEQLKQLPIPEECPNAGNTGSSGGGGAGTVGSTSGSGKTIVENGVGTCSTTEDPSAEIKSPVSLVHETALKRGLPVSFKVVSETGKPHIRTFTTQCTVGDKETIGEGSSKKVSKKNAAELMLEELKRLPPLPTTVTVRSAGMKRKPSNTKKPRRNLIRDNQGPRTDSDNTEEVDPISRLVQIQHSKREREPIYRLVEEKGGPRRREFLMEVTIGQFSAQGIGSNKKLSKKAAAEALLAQLGYSKPAQPQPTKPSIKSTSKDSNNSENRGNDGNSGKLRKVTFLEDEQINNKENQQQTIVGGGGGRQLAPGLLLVDPAGQQDSKLSGNGGGNSVRDNLQNNQNGPTLQAVADALRGQQNNQQTTNGLSPKDQLMYLAQLLNFKATFVDFPKASYNRCLSLVSLSTDPPQVCHGSGSTVNESRNQAVLTALRTLGKLGLDTSAKPEKEILPDDAIEIHDQTKKVVINQPIDK